MNGRIVPGVLPGLLREIYVSRQTGMLRFARGEEHCSIRFAKGHIVYGFASEKRLHMGEVMVAEGLLSRENLDRATHVVIAEKKRLGQALESLGLVDSELLEEFLAIHLRAILLDVFSWRDGMYLFEEEDQLRDSNHFELLGVLPTARESEVEAAFLRLAKRYHPDVHHDPALGDLLDKLETIFFSLSQAHRVLSDPSSREAYRVQLERPGSGVPELPPTQAKPASMPDPASQAAHAEALFRAGEERFKEAKYWEAVALLGEAVRVAEGRLRLRPRLLLARAHLKHPEKEREAEKELQAVLEADPEHVEAHLHLGTVYKRRGWKARASSMFRRVLELDPSHREAIAELGTLETKPGPAQESDATTLVKKLFGRS